MAEKVKSTYQLGVKKAYQLCAISRSSYYYQQKGSKIKEVNEELKMRLQELATNHPSWGFKKMLAVIRAERLVAKKESVNHKRLHRLYSQLQLNLRIKPRKRLATRTKRCLSVPLKPNECWSLDFMSDSLVSGCKYRILNVIDDHNREAIAIRPDFSLPAERVTEILDRLIICRGLPAAIRIDNGPEFISKKFQQWAADRGIKLLHIQPGKPAQNAFIERFNRTYREDVLDMHIFDHLAEVRMISANWQKFYNQHRPHEALNKQAPSQYLTTQANLTADSINLANKATNDYDQNLYF